MWAAGAALAASAVVVPGSAHADPARPGQNLNYSPHSRTVRPVAVYNTSGTVTDAGAVLSGRRTRLTGAGSFVTLDFGKDVAGLVSLRFAGSDGAQRVGLAFNESSMYVGTTSDASTGGPRSRDGAIYADVNGRTRYTMPGAQLRGGFRYLTIFLDSAGWVDLDRVSLHFTAAPAMRDPADYADYFSSSDSLLNRIWYAGAYTVQLDTIAPTTGRAWPAPDTAWDNSGTVGVGDTILVDGAKRDRTVWPGDLGIEIPTAYAAFNDTVSARNALTTLYQAQKSTGELPYAGPELAKYGSDTYHLWTLAATAQYFQYTGDRAWLDSVWSRYRSAVEFSLAKVDANGLLSITETADAVRSLPKGENLLANVLLWRVLSTGSELARVEGDTALGDEYAGKAAALKAAVNAAFWDPAAGVYRFYPGSPIHPQDGNALAAWYGLADQTQARDISSVLKGNWNDRGTTSPENKGNPGVFAGSMEVNAHFAAGGQAADQAGVDIIRREWGYMLDNPAGTGSTFWESYRAAEDCVFCSTYVSLAHGWATGPTSALTFYVLGLDPTGTGGRTFDFVPHPADLTFARGRLTTTFGPVDASWRYDARRRTFTERIRVPRGTTARVGVPTYGRQITVTVNGRRVAATGDGDYVYLTGLSAGSYTITGRAR
jgi:hypothetical protein